MLADRYRGLESRGKRRPREGEKVAPSQSGPDGPILATRSRSRSAYLTRVPSASEARGIYDVLWQDTPAQFGEKGAFCLQPDPAQSSKGCFPHPRDRSSQAPSHGATAARFLQGESFPSQPAEHGRNAPRVGFRGLRRRRQRTEQVEARRGQLGSSIYSGCASGGTWPPRFRVVGPPACPRRGRAMGRGPICAHTICPANDCPIRKTDDFRSVIADASRSCLEVGDRAATLNGHAEMSGGGPPVTPVNNPTTVRAVLPADNDNN
ncbi:Protein of unknown function [Gryllus bimaculatus]|nr:Protein of unknown function [Gryllus bimaculatus]